MSVNLQKSVDTQTMRCPRCGIVVGEVTVKTDATLGHRSGDVQTVEWGNVEFASLARCDSCGFDGIAGEFVPGFAWTLEPLNLEVSPTSREAIGLDRARVRITPAMARKIVRLACQVRKNEDLLAQVEDRSPALFDGGKPRELEDFEQSFLHVTSRLCFWEFVLDEGDLFETELVGIDSLLTFGSD